MIRRYYFGIISPISKEVLKLQITRGWEDILGNYDCAFSVLVQHSGHFCTQIGSKLDAPLAGLVEFFCSLDLLLVSVKYLVWKM